MSIAGTNNKIKAEDYGDILALKVEGEKLYYSEEGGSYQGEYVAVIKSEKTVNNYYSTKLAQYYVFIGDYGSCSGCDWLEDERDTLTGEVDVKNALEYATQSVPVYILPEKPTKEWVDALAKKIN